MQKPNHSGKHTFPNRIFLILFAALMLSNLPSFSSKATYTGHPNWNGKDPVSHYDVVQTGTFVETAYDDFLRLLNNGRKRQEVLR